jgi:general secretion pathway protein A
MSEYLAHFGLRESPFARNHNPKWLYLSGQHKEAILKTRWTVEEHGGLVLWRGDVGLGKSSMIEYVMAAWHRQFGWHMAALQNTGSITGPHILLAEILAAFGLEQESTTRRMVAKLEEWLLVQNVEHNRNVVLVIDEAQSIASKAYPVIRDLLNLETRDQILLNIVLAGQLNIDRKLNGFPALRSRIASVSSLLPLSSEECDGLLLHRLEVAGAYDPFRLYTSQAARAIYDFSCGIPRDIVTIAEAAMKEAFLRDARAVDRDHVLQGVRSLQGRNDYMVALGEDIAVAAPVNSFSETAARSLRDMKEKLRAA